MKKLLSLVLAVILMLSCIPMASAESYNHLPQVYVEGLESKHIFYKDDVNMENPLFYPINGDMLLSKLVKYEENISKAVAQGNPDLIAEYLHQWMLDCYGMVALDKDGFTMRDDVMVPATELNYEGDGKYVFKYDTRLDPMDIAVELDAYIKWVMSETRAEKVEIAASSYGASVALAYITKYPARKSIIDSMVLCVPATNGVNFASALFSGKLEFDPLALKAMVDSLDVGEPVSLLLSTLIKTGALATILDGAVEPVLEAALSRALQLVIRDVFGTFPSMWTFIEHKDFYDALEFVYGENYADENHEYAVHIARITNYHETVMNHSYDIVADAVKSGIHVGILTKYGEAPIPIGDGGNLMGDGFVALDKASFGATSSMNQEKLPADYKQQKHTEYNLMSPEGCVDASTCLLPFNTWFIRGIAHGSKNDGYYELINTVLYENLDVFSSEKFPQYLMVPEYDNGALVPMTADIQPDEEKQTSWLQDFMAFIRSVIPMLIEKIKAFFVK